MQSFKALGARMSVNVHVLRSNLGYFPVENTTKNKVKGSTKTFLLWKKGIREDGA